MDGMDFINAMFVVKYSLDEFGTENCSDNQIVFQTEIVSKFNR